MNILDENFPEGEKRILQSWHIAVRQIGVDIGHSGMKDIEIITLLHTLRRTTFFTLDFDFYKRELCHPRYCLVYLEVDQKEAAAFARRFLRHPQFNTEAKRMYSVVRVAITGLRVWRLTKHNPIDLGW